MKIDVERLDKLLASRAGMSRKEAKALIRAGAVLVNGTPAAFAEQKLGESDTVIVNGEALDLEKHVYYMMNKPAGILSATTDPDCETVLDLLPPKLRRKGLFPAGRLDKDTEGFVIITDDGGFAHRILSPKNHVPKKYFVRLDKNIPGSLRGEFAAGLKISGGDICSAAELSILESGYEAELVIFEGMYHQVKRMFAEFSLEVVYLKRVKIGGLELDPALGPGEARKILHKEIGLIDSSFGGILHGNAESAK